MIADQAAMALRTLVFGGITAVLATGLGWVLAHVHHAHTFRGRRALHLFALAGLLLPSLTFAMALVILFGHSGLVTRALGAPTGAVYGLPGLVVAGTLARLPWAYLALSSAYRGFDARLFEAAVDLGASPVRLVRSVLLPRLWPALVATASVIMADTVADLALPLVVGGDYGVLSVRVYQAVHGEGDVAAALAHALWLLPMTVLLWPLGRLFAPRPGAMDPDLRPTRRPLGASERWLVAIGWLVVGAGALLVAAVAFGSLTVAVGVDHTVTTLHLRDVLAGSNTLALATTVVVAIVVTAIVCVVTLLLAHATTARTGRLLRRVLGALASIPGLVLGLGVFVALQDLDARGVLPRSWAGATPWAGIGVLVGVQVLRFVPTVATPMVGVAERSWRATRDAAVALRAPQRRVNRLVLQPQLRPDVLAGGLNTFARCLTSISPVVLLTTAHAPLLSIRMLVAAEAGQLSAAAAMNMVLAALTGAAMLAVLVLRLTAGRGGS